MKILRNRRYLLIGVVAIIVVAVSLFLVLRPKEELNLIESKYITIKGQTLENGDFRVELEILQPRNIQIDEWHSWIEGTLGYKSPLKSGTKGGIYAYTLSDIPTQKLTVFLTIGGKETIFNEMFTDFFMNQFDHVVPEVVTEEETVPIEETETEELSPLQKFFAPVPGFDFYLILIPLLLLYKWRKNHVKDE